MELKDFPEDVVWFMAMEVVAEHIPVGTTTLKKMQDVIIKYPQYFGKEKREWAKKSIIISYNDKDIQSNSLE